MKNVQPSNLFEKKIKDIFKTKSDTEMQLFFQTLSLLMYQHNYDSSLIDLYDLLDKENFLKVLNLFSGKKIEFPKIEKLKDTMIMSLLYIERYIRNKSWDEIKKTFPFDINTISYGLKLKQLDSFIKEKLDNIYAKLVV